MAANPPSTLQRLLIAALCVTLPAVLGWGLLALLFRVLPEPATPPSEIGPTVITPNPAKAPRSFRGDPAVEVLMEYDPRWAFRASGWLPMFVVGCLLWVVATPWIFRGEAGRPANEARSRRWIIGTSVAVGLLLAWPWMLSLVLFLSPR